MMRSVTALAVVAFSHSLAPSAHAASPEPGERTPELGERKVLTGFEALDRPTGIAEAGFGWLTLPGANVCSASACKATFRSRSASTTSSASPTNTARAEAAHRLAQLVLRRGGEAEARVVVAVLIVHGGVGGDVAAPIARAMIDDALQQ